MKSLILPSRVWNVYDETMPKWSFGTNLNILGDAQGIEFDFAQGSYEVVDILEIIQDVLDAYYVPVEIFFNRDRKRVTLKLFKKILRRRNIVHWFSMVI